MDVGGQRHHRRGVAEPLGDDVHRLAGQQEQGGVRVPEIVKADRGHLPAALHVTGELAGDMLGVAVLALDVTEHQDARGDELQG